MNCRNGEQGHASALSCTQHPHPQPNGSNLRHPIPAHPARLQPHSAEIRRWRRQPVQMGRKICVCLSRCNPWRKIYSGVGNSSAQTVGDHAPREWEDPQAKRSGGMERSGSLCGRVAAPRETMYGIQCGSIGKQLRVSKSGPDVPDC